MAAGVKTRSPRLADQHRLSPAATAIAVEASACRPPAAS